MNRRDFFLMKTEGSDQVLELSCETLYMRYLEIESADRIGSSEEGQLAGVDWWSGEPPSERITSSSNKLFNDLDQQLSKVNKVRLLQVDWLIAGDFRTRVEALLFAHCERGGELEFAADCKNIKKDKNKTVPTI